MHVHNAGLRIQKFNIFVQGLRKYLSASLFPERERGPYIVFFMIVTSSTVGS